MQVFKNIFLIDGVDYDSNIYIVDGAIVVDAGTGNFFKEIKDEIKNLGLDPVKLKTLINTHAHFDHVGGNKKFKDWLGIRIMAYQSDAKQIEQGEVLSELFKTKFEKVSVDSVLHEGDVLKTKNFSFEVIHTPGHTPGSICLYEKSKGILISGDTVFSDGIGRTDLPGGSPRDMANSLKRLSKLKINYIFPGHGSVRTEKIGALFKQVLSK